MSREASTDHPVHELMARRWSPCGYQDREVSDQDLRSLFEAARWAASSYNEQPWHYIVATRSQAEEYKRLLSCLVEPNQAWARNAPVLALSVASYRFKRNDKPNRCAEHDLGAASASLTLEATSRGLVVHQMAGILPDRAREIYGIPGHHEALAGLAIGYVADPESLPEELRQRDTAPRERKPLGEFVFTGSWKNTSPIVT